MAPARARLETSPDEALHPPDERLRVDLHTDAIDTEALARDVSSGLLATPRSLPGRWRHDAAGSRLFDQICYAPEYYPTRCESTLLGSVGAALIEYTRPACLVELAAGAARRTRKLLDALVHVTPAPVYAPLELSEDVLRHTAFALLERYPTLRVHAIVGDYERHLDAMPDAGRRLIAFLGGAIGALEDTAADALLHALRRTMRDDDRLLLGVDLVKDASRMERAYNDAAGLWATFDRNVLAVINRELGADFHADRFDHVAVYDPATTRVTLSLRSRCDHHVLIPGAGMTVHFAEGDCIRTGIERKFTRDSLAGLLAGAGLAIDRLDVDDEGMYALALARIAP